MKDKHETITIPAPSFKTVCFTIEGMAPYVQNKFSSRQIKSIKDVQEKGQKAKKGNAKEAKDFDRACDDAKYVSTKGFFGIPAPAFRSAMVSACRTVGFKMTHAKLAVFIEADGFDREDHTPLVKITEGKPERFDAVVRLPNGSTDIRPRPMWAPGWRAELKIRFDSDMLAMDDIANLLNRVGNQVGVGEGRPDSKKSCGMGWGLFKIVNEREGKNE